MDKRMDLKCTDRKADTYTILLRLNTSKVITKVGGNTHFIKTNLSHIMDYIGQDPTNPGKSNLDDAMNLIKRAENHLQSNHLLYFSLRDNMVEGRVQASMKSSIWNVQITLKGKKVQQSDCTCPAGAGEAGGQGGRCSHVAVLLLHIHRNVSCTDTPCQWSSRKADDNTAVQTIEELVGHEVFMASDELKLCLRSRIRTNLEKVAGPTAVKWLLQDEPPEDVDDFSERDMENILFTDEFLSVPGYSRDMCSISEADIHVLAKKTVGQFNNRKYCLLKKYRVTASNFGCVLSAIRRQKYPPSLFKRLLGAYNCSKARPILWGTAHEPVAFQEFLKAHGSVYGLDFEACGMYLHTSGVLAASPDSISSKYSLEIKCPYTHRDATDLKVALAPKEKKSAKKKTVISTKVTKRVNKRRQPAPAKPKRGDYIVNYIDGAWRVNCEHDYYHQIQGQLYFSGKERGLLFIWTTKTSKLFVIEKDRKWASNIDKLLHFYFEIFVPHCLSDSHNIVDDIDDNNVREISGHSIKNNLSDIANIRIHVDNDGTSNETVERINEDESDIDNICIRVSNNEKSNEIVERIGKNESNIADIYIPSFSN